MLWINILNLRRIYIIKQIGAVYHTAPVILLYVLIVFIIDRLRAYTI